MCWSTSEVSAYGAVTSKTWPALKLVFLAWDYCIDGGRPNVRNVQACATFAALHARKLYRPDKIGDRIISDKRLRGLFVNE